MAHLLFRQHMEEELASLRRAYEELRDWDTVHVTWYIKQFDKTISSAIFFVAQNSMQLQMSVRNGIGDNQSEFFGFHIIHCPGSCNYVPISIGLSEISLVGRDASVESKTKRYGRDDRIDKVGSGWGWSEFVSKHDLRDKYTKDGQVTLKAKVRVRRLTKIQV